jgi:hypothetical protein
MYKQTHNLDGELSSFVLHLQTNFTFIHGTMLATSAPLFSKANNLCLRYNTKLSVSLFQSMETEINLTWDKHCLI